MNKTVLKVGITGGIGSGKSYVSRMLEKKGMPIYDSDMSAKRLMIEDPCIRSGLVSLLGKDVYLNGSLNKSLIASYLFSSSENASHINAIIHPRVREDFLFWSQKQNALWVGMECAILFEAGFSNIVDFIVSVSAPVDIRIHRASLRDNTSEDAIRKRINAQMGEEERCRLSDFVVINDGTPLEPQIDSLLKILKSGKPFR